MTKPKHTPGPWSSVKYTGIIADSKNMRIARADSGGPAEVDEANACLIAAAPELLAALKEFVADIEAIDETGACLDWPDLAVSYRKAKAALNKAEGK